MAQEPNLPSDGGAVLRIVGDSGARHQPRPLASPADWRLRIGGEVEHPRELSLEELLALEAEPVELVHDITCVSAAKIAPGGGPVRFGGVRFTTLARLVAPRPWPEGGELGPSVELISRAPATVGPRDKRHHTFMALADCLDPASGVLLATTLDGRPLPYANGGPLRSVVGATFFFYKAIKWLEEIRFVHRPLDECRGTWEEYSGYHVRARVALNERFEPRMHRIVAVDPGEDGAAGADTLELVPREEWAAVFGEMLARRDLSRLSAAQLHKMSLALPKEFRGVRFHDGPFHAKIRGTSFASTDFAGCDLSGCNFSLSKFTNARFAGEGETPARLEGCDFEGAFFNNAHLQGVSMAGSSLSNTTFFGPRDFDKPTDRVRGLDVRHTTHLDPHAARWLARNGALV